MGACRPARAAYAAAEAAVFPVEAHTTERAPSASAFETTTVIPRSLKLPVGFAPSHLSQISVPVRSDRRGALRSGVDPSPSETIAVPGARGKRSRKRSA